MKLKKYEIRYNMVQDNKPIMDLKTIILANSIQEAETKLINSMRNMIGTSKIEEIFGLDTREITD